MKITKLEWDSLFFNKKIGKLEIENIKEFNRECFMETLNEDFDLVYVVALNKMLPLNELLNLNIEIVDVLVTMSMAFDSSKYHSEKNVFRQELTHQEKKDAYIIAEQTSIVSRFYNEPLIGSKKTKELYRKWIDNTLNKSFSDGLFLEKDNNKVIGIHLIKTLINERTGMFTLTGVEKNYKRMGIGSSLWKQSLGYWANQNNIDQVKSPFSFQNKESLNFHLKMGFNKITEVKYLYHYRK